MENKVEKDNLVFGTDSVAKSEPKTAKKAAKTEAKTAKAVKDEPKTEAKTAKKTTAKKSTTTKKATKKETAAKETQAKKTTKKSVKTELVLQYGSKEIDEQTLVARVTDDLKAQGVEAKDIKLYLKPEDEVCYYVANGNVEGKVDLY